jgi:hypothetical protein
MVQSADAENADDATIAVAEYRDGFGLGEQGLDDEGSHEDDDNVGGDDDLVPMLQATVVP